jgi:DNA-binding response OmpR family regulator
MKISGLVLLVGRDETLLTTRRWVLEAAGNRVRVASQVQEAAQVVSEGDISLMLLCQTLSQDETMKLQALGRELEVPTMQLEGSVAPVTLIEAVQHGLQAAS